MSNVLNGSMPRSPNDSIEHWFLEFDSSLVIRPSSFTLRSLNAVESHAASGATDAEIAAYFGLPEEQLRAHFQRQLDKCRAAIHTRLRAAQLKIALEGNPTLLTWLGRHELHQDTSEPQGFGPEPLKTYIGIDLDAV